MELWASSPCSQYPATCPCTAPGQPTPFPSYFLETPFSTYSSCLMPCPPFRSWRCSEGTVRLFSTFRNMFSVDCAELLAPHSTPKLDFHPLSVVPDCLFIISAGMFRIWRPPPPHRKLFSFYGGELLDYHPCQLLALLHIWRPCPPTTTWGRAITFWQGLAYHGGSWHSLCKAPKFGFEGSFFLTCCRRLVVRISFRHSDLVCGPVN